MQSLGESAPRVVVLGTGGTIAGTARRPGDHVGYVAAQLGVEQLVAAVPALGGVALECEQVAQLDSKDMDHATWQRLAQRAAHHLARADVCGLVVTHGTDTMEETAYFLQRVLAPAKPVVLTGAMRPATALQADGPQNLWDAVRVARHPGARGVVVVVASAIHDAHDVRKQHSFRIDAFGSGDAAPIGYVEGAGLRLLRSWPSGDDALGLGVIASDPSQWPWVELVFSYAAANGRNVDALVRAGVRGLVAAGTGNGTLHRELEAALRAAEAAGVAVRRTTRVAQGMVVGDAAPYSAARAHTAVQARVELMLELMLCG